MAGLPFFTKDFFTNFFFAAGLLLDLLAFAPFLGARDTATIHPLFLEVFADAIYFKPPDFLAIL